jgi:hypothetical protein
MKISRVNSCLSVAGTGVNSVPPNKQGLSLPFYIRFYSQSATIRARKHISLSLEELWASIKRFDRTRLSRQSQVFMKSLLAYMSALERMIESGSPCR